MITAAALLALDRWPAASAIETALGHRWIADHGGEWEHFAVNLRLGSGFDPGQSFSAGTRSAAVLATQKRADLVAVRPGEVGIFEIKLRGGLSSVGQLYGYAVLYSREHGPVGKTHLGLIATMLDTDLWLVLTELGIRPYLYPDVPLTLPAGARRIA